MTTDQLNENTRYRERETVRENTLSSVKDFYSEGRKIIVGFVNGKYPLPKRYVPNTYSFNKSEIDVSEFLPEGKDKRVVPKDKDFDFEFRRMLAKK